MRVPPSPRLSALSRCPHGSVSDAELRSFGLAPESVLDFSASTNPLGPSPLVREALASVSVARYPDDEARELRAALSQRLGVPAEALLFGNGSVELIWLACFAYLDPGDVALVVGPTFGEYERAAKIAGASVVAWNARPREGFEPRVDEIAALIEETRPRLVFVCNPNNPTGSYLRRGQVEQLVRANRSGMLVLDEAYLAFTDHPDPMLDLIDEGQTLVLRSLTKDHALAGLRLGYAVAAPQVIEQLEKVRPPWNVNAAAQAAGLAALRDPLHVERARAEVAVGKAVLRDRLSDLGLWVVPSAANFLMVEVGNGCDFRRRLLERGCCIRDCASFGLPSYVRIGVRTRAECERLLDAFSAVLSEDDAR